MRSEDRHGAFAYLWSLNVASAALSCLCFAVTNRYLARQGSLVAAGVTGAVCGSVCCAMISLALLEISLPLAQFLAVFVPALCAVLLASVPRA
jgi:hypothetical protein